MPFSPKKGQKRAKVSGAVGQNQHFCILLNIVSLHFFGILHEVRDHYGVKVDPKPFFKENSLFANFGHFQ